MIKRLLTPEEVADVLQLHHLTVLKYIKQKKLRALKLGRVYRIREEDLQQFFQDQATA
ncbi:MAG: excisionase family DNA binding protein [Oceanicoccus sp.]|jgi:excisionase family DNA binding protein